MDSSSKSSAGQADTGHPEARFFSSATVDRVRASGNIWQLEGGQLQLPEAFGFCRGVERALVMVHQAVLQHRNEGRKLLLLGEIIHNPWVNNYFRQKGIQILSRSEQDDLERVISPDDCAIIPAFGIPPAGQRRLEKIGCEVVNTTCGDVRRLWTWSERAVRRGFAVLIFGRPLHDETMVTKVHLAEAGGQYVVANRLEQVRLFCKMITGDLPADDFTKHFDSNTTNAASLDSFQRLAQVSQTTMLCDETMQVRELLTEAFALRYGRECLDDRLALEPTVCQATQARQAAAVQLCSQGCDLVMVVGGFGSSNTRHLFELAGSYCPAYFIEDAGGIVSATEIRTINPDDTPHVAKNWLPDRRPLKIGVLAGASSPEVVVGGVLERLAGFLS